MDDSPFPAPSQVDRVAFGDRYCDAVEMCGIECAEIHGACPTGVCQLIVGLCGPERTRLLREVVYSQEFVSRWLDILWASETGR